MTFRIKLWLIIAIILYVLISIYNGHLQKNITPIETATTENPKKTITVVETVKQAEQPVKVSKVDTLQISANKKDLRIKELEKQLLNSHKNIRNLETVVTRSSEETQNLLLESNKQNKQIVLLQNKIDDFQRSIKKRDIALARANRSIARHMTGQIQASRELKLEKDQVEELRVKIRESLFDLKDLQLVRANLKDRTNALSIANERIQALAMKLETSSADLASAENTIMELQQIVSQSSTANVKNQQLSAKQSTKINNLRENLQKKIADTGGLYAQLIEAKSRITVLNEELEKANLVADAMLRYGNEKDRQLAPSTQELWTKNKLLREKTEALKIAQFEFSSLNKQQLSLSVALDDAKITLQKKDNALEGALKNNQKLTSELYSANKILTILKTSFNNANQKSQKLTENIEVLDSKFAALQTTIANNDKTFVILKTAFTKSNKAKEETSGKLQAAEKNNRLLKKQLTAVNQNIKDQESNAAHLSTELSTSAEKILLLNTALENTKNKVGLFQHKETQKDEQLKTYQQNSNIQALTLQEKSQIIDRLTSEIATTKTGRDRMNVRQQQTIKNLDKELNKTKSLLQDKESALASANSNAEKLTDRLNETTRFLDGLKEEKESIQSQLNSALSQLDSLKEAEAEPHTDITSQLQNKSQIKLREAEEQIRQLKKLIENKGITQQELTNTLKKVENEKEDLALQIVSARSKIKNLTKTAQPENNKGNALPQTENTTNHVQASDSGILQTLSGKLKRIEKQLQEKKNKLMLRQIERTHLLKKISTLQNERNLLHQRVMVLQVERAFFDKQVTSLQTKGRELKREVMSGQVKRGFLRKKVHLLQTERDALKQKIMIRQVKETFLKKQIEQLKTTSDSDNDSVSDINDKCPDTAADIAVDNDGCEKDSDLDGLVDRLDLCPQSPQGITIDKIGCSLGETIILAQVKFTPGTASLTEDAKRSLQHIQKILHSVPEQRFELAGFTDNIGEIKRNQQVSLLRARAVMQFLIEQGIAQNKLVANGYGPTKPIGNNNTRSGRAKNRRVELYKIKPSENYSPLNSVPNIVQ